LCSNPVKIRLKRKIKMKKILITTLIVVLLAAAIPASGTFTDNGDGTVTDDVTGLMWIQNDNSTPQGKDAACAYCEDLVFAGYEDWRAPTIKELQTIVDYGYDSPAIDGSVFDIATVGNQYWSSTPLPSIPSFAWGIYTSSGIVDSLWSNSYIRCVRGNVLETTFVANGDGETVTSSNGLVWSKQTSDSNMSWEDANAYCNTLEAGGMSEGWFLPTVEELGTLVAYDRVNPAADTSFFEVAAGSAYYWTATEQAGSTGNNAWQIKFENGYIAPADKISAGWVRCAHEAPPENFCECPDCPVCEPEIVEVPIEKIVYVESPCSCGDCDLSGLTTYSELKAKQEELSKAIKELKNCHVAATHAMYKAREAERKAFMAKKKAEHLDKQKAKKDKNQ
jgi:hypothetical protein